MDSRLNERSYIIPGKVFWEERCGNSCFIHLCFLINNNNNNNIINIYIYIYIILYILYYIILYIFILLYCYICILKVLVILGTDILVQTYSTFVEARLKINNITVKKNIQPPKLLALLFYSA